MLIYNLLQYSSNYSELSWFYSTDKATNFNVDMENTGHFKSFSYKAKLLGNSKADGENLILREHNNFCVIKASK